VKLTFEGESMLEIVMEMEYVIEDYRQLAAFRDVKRAAAQTPTQAPTQGSGPDIVPSGNVPVDKPVEKPVKKHSPAVEKMLAAKAAKKAAREAAELKPELGMMAGTVPDMIQPPPPKTAEGMDPAEVVRIRQKTIEDLQSAYANGYQKEVFELLSRFGNGAKSFRELPADAFVPIREAIDNGALT
jgi:hypothetical protein